jgi:hypothetical protein
LVWCFRTTTFTEITIQPSVDTPKVTRWGCPAG